MRGVAVGLVAMVAGGAMSAAVGGCGESDIYICDPANWPDGSLPPRCFPDSGTPDDGGGGGGSDPGDAAADAPIEVGCEGRCLPLAPDGWGSPDFVWMGPEGDAPPCPEAAPKLGYEGYADLDAPIACGGCQCGASTGTCSLPSVITASAAVCPGDGAIFTPTDPPAGWDGSCSTNHPVAADALCAGSPCVQSVTFGALSVTESCAPSVVSAPEIAPPTWHRFVRSCRTYSLAACPTHGLVCVPPPPPGYHVCVYIPGDADCSKAALAPYTEKHLFYDTFSDSRSCTACACGPPVGSSCTSEVTLYSDDACTSLPVASVLADALHPLCLDVIPGSALGSKSATAPVYTPGPCMPSGGEPTGSAEPVFPSTFCCLPTP